LHLQRTCHSSAVEFVGCHLVHSKPLERADLARSSERGRNFPRMTQLVIKVMTVTPQLTAGSTVCLDNSQPQYLDTEHEGKLLTNEVMRNQKKKQICTSNIIPLFESIDIVVGELRIHLPGDGESATSMAAKSTTVNPS
jgi:hypothetical protein